MRVLGEDNDIYGAHVWNTYCPQQFEHSVCFINGKSNTYTACVADKFHIGWLSYRSTPFYLTNCHWLNKDVKVNGKVMAMKLMLFISEKNAVVTVAAEFMQMIATW